MFNLGKLFVSFEARTKPFDDALAVAERNAQASAAAIGGLTDFKFGGKGGVAGPMQEAAAQSDALAGEMRQALMGGLAPLNAIGGKIAAQINNVGGVVVAMARKIDGAMRFQAAEAAAQRLEKSIEAALKKSADSGVESLSRIERATIRLGPAALKSLQAFNRFDKLKSTLGSLFAGDIGRKQLEKNLDLSKPVAGAGKLKTGLAGVAPVVNTATASVKRLGGEIALALGVFGLAYKAVQFFKEGIAGAANLNETVSKTEVIFQGATGSVAKFADEMASKYGLVKRSTLDAASGFGGMVDSLGWADQKMADFSITMTKLAADTMSQANISFEEAGKSLKIALAGNQSDVLREMGVILTDDAVKAEALAKGYARAGGEIDEGAKIMARASLIQEKLARVNGDLENTAGSAANQFRKLQGNVINSATAVGQVFLPAITRGTVLLNRFADWAGSAFEGKRGSIEAFAGNLSAGFDNVATAFRDLWGMASRVPAAFEEAFGDGPRRMVEGLAETIQGGFAAAGVVLRNLPAFAEIAGLKLYQVFANAGEYWSAVGSHIVDVAAWVAENWYDVIVDGFTAVQTWLVNWWTNVANLARAGYAAMRGEGFHFEWKPLAEGFEAMLAKMPQMADVGFTDLSREVEAKLKEIGEREAEHAASLVKKAEPKATPPRKKPAPGDGDGKKAKEKEPEEYGFAEFARKLRSRQWEQKDKAVEENTKAVGGLKGAVEKATEAFDKGIQARFA